MIRNHPSLQLQAFLPLMRLARWYQLQLLKKGPAALQRFRKSSDQLADILFHIPPGIRVEEVQLEGLPGTWLIPDGASDNPVILFLHGGGNFYTWGSPHRRMVGLLAKSAGMAAFGLDFRLAPDHPYPAAHQDCLQAYQALVEQKKQVLLVGESSGGLLALSTILRSRELGLPLPSLAAFLSPLVDYQAPDLSEYADPFVHPDFVNTLSGIYLAGQSPPDRDCRPLTADFRGFPPLYIMAGEREILRGQAEKLANKAHQDGVEAVLELFPWVWHGWHILAPQLPEANQAMITFGRALHLGRR